MIFVSRFAGRRERRQRGECNDDGNMKLARNLIVKRREANEALRASSA
jgi:hypothetical protein